MPAKTDPRRRRMNIDPNTLNVARIVDARGTACPGPLLDAKRAMAEVPIGGVLEVMSSDSGTSEDIPLWSRKVGHDFLGIVEEAGYWRLFVKRGK